jgi:predicted transcriptional regulator
MKKITVNISDEQARRLAAVARERKLSRDEIVQEALSLFMRGDPRLRMAAVNVEFIERERLAAGAD